MPEDAEKKPEMEPEVAEDQPEPAKTEAKADKKPEQIKVGKNGPGPLRKLVTTALRYTVGLTAAVGAPYMFYHVGTDSPPFTDPNVAESIANTAEAITLTAVGVGAGAIALFYTITGAK